MRRKIILLVSIIAIAIYLGLYFNKVYIYREIESKATLGVSDNFIIYTFFSKKKRIPFNANELKTFIMNNKQLFEDSDFASFLLNKKFNFLQVDSNNTIYVYESGPNYRDDKMRKLLNSSDFNVFNFLLKDGDILLFYSTQNDINYRMADSTILIDKNRVEEFINRGNQ